jgi:hypothetical protein
MPEGRGSPRAFGGGRRDWGEMGLAAQNNPALYQKIVRVCDAYVRDPYAQRYHCWKNYVESRQQKNT